MKNILKSIVLLSIILITACNKEDGISPSQDLNNKVSELIGDNLEIPTAKQIQTKEWKCSEWDINFYQEAEKVGEWDGYEKTVKAEEKQQVYRLDENGSFNILAATKTELKSATNDTTYSYKYEWKEDGTLIIDGIQLIVKFENNELVIYYNVNDAVKVGKIFNVSIDNTYGDNLNDQSIEGLGVIRFVQLNPLDEQINADMSTQELVEKFLAQEKIQEAVYLGMRTDGEMTIILDKGTKPAIAINFQYMGGVQLENQRAEKLFNALISNDSFEVLNSNVNISRITFQEKSKSIFVVEGYTQFQEPVSFLYNIDKDEQSWIIAPPTNNAEEIASYDLVQKFHDRTPLFDYVFESLSATSENYTFGLSGSSDGGYKKVKILDNLVDLSNVTPVRAKTLFTAFLGSDGFTFEDVVVTIDSINHEDASGGSFLVYGETQENKESISFYYNTKTEKQHWIIAPAAISGENKISSFDLVQKFINQDPILGSEVYTELKKHGNNWLLQGGNFEKEVVLSTNSDGIYRITQEGMISVFVSLIDQTLYKYDNFNITIDGIRFAEGETSGLIMYGYTTNQEYVEVYYNFDTYEDKWIKSPSTSVPTINSYDLVQKFNDRSPIDDNVFNTIEWTDDLYIFQLDTHNKYMINDQTVDLSNVTPVRAKDIYQAFLTRSNFTFNNTIVVIDKITHESGNGGNLIAYALTQSEERVSFYYDTNQDKQHWLDAPQ